MNIPALKAAPRAYSGPMAINPEECVYCHNYGNMQGFITYAQAAEAALKRIEELERESLAYYRSSAGLK